MYDLDLLLGAKCRRQHQQDLIGEAQRYKLACDARNHQKKHEALTSLHIIRAAIINRIARE